MLRQQVFGDQYAEDQKSHRKPYFHNAFVIPSTLIRNLQSEPNRLP